MKDGLSTMDRMTLRVWRAFNLIGWGLAGVGVTLGTAWVWVRLAERIRWAWPSVDTFSLGLLVSGLALCGVPAGILVGAHVYRRPGLVGGLAVAAPGMVALLVTPASDAGALELLLPVVAALLAAAAARARYRRRPRALRGSR